MARSKNMVKRKKEIDYEQVEWLAGEGFSRDRIIRGMRLNDLKGKEKRLVDEALEKGERPQINSREKNGNDRTAEIEEDQMEADLIEVQMLAAEGLSFEEVLNEMVLELEYFDGDDFEEAYEKGVIAHDAVISRAITGAAKRGVPSALKVLQKRREETEAGDLGEFVDGVKFRVVRVIMNTEDGGVLQYHMPEREGGQVWEVKREAGKETTLTLKSGADPTTREYKNMADPEWKREEG